MSHFMSQVGILEPQNSMSLSPCEITYLCRKLLQPPYVNGPFLWGIQVAASHTQLWGGTNHSAGESQGVVREDGTGWPVVVLVKTKISKLTLKHPHSSMVCVHVRVCVCPTLLDILVINDLMSRLVGQLFWQGASTHLRHLWWHRKRYHTGYRFMVFWRPSK